MKLLFSLFYLIGLVASMPQIDNSVQTDAPCSVLEHERIKELNEETLPKACQFPFIYKGVTYNECTAVEEDKPWCSTDTNPTTNEHVEGSGHWGFCSQENCPKEVGTLDKIFIGKFDTYQHEVSGDIYSIGDNQLFIDNFVYDGKAPDAFFWVGTKGETPSEDGILLAHPFEGTFYEKTDSRATKLGKISNAPITLTLPDGIKVSSLKWISVWCRTFKEVFGDFIFS